MLKRILIFTIILFLVLSPVDFNTFKGERVQSAGMELITIDTTWSGNIKKDNKRGEASLFL